MNDAAAAVAEYLQLDVARLGHEALEIDAVVPERGGCFAARGGERFFQLFGFAHHAHAATAAARGGFDEQRITEVIGRRRSLTVPARSGRNDGDVVRDRELARADLVAHRGDRVGRGPDEVQAGILDGTCERGVLGQEAVARVYGIGGGATGGFDDARNVQIARCGRVAAERLGHVREGDVCRVAVGIGVDRDGLDAHLARRTHDATRDLRAVRDQQATDRSGT